MKAVKVKENSEAKFWTYLPTKRHRATAFFSIVRTSTILTPNPNPNPNPKGP